MLSRIFVVLALIMVTAGASADEGVAEPCPSGATPVALDHGFTTGCERASRVTGKPVRVGEWSWRDARHRLALRVHYNDWGQEDGALTQYDSQGREIGETHFSDGVAEGTETRWWPGSGHLREIGELHAGKLHGVRKRWTYAPTEKSCSPDKEECWAGSQECWLAGVRQAPEACDGLYAGGPRASNRQPASR